MTRSDRLLADRNPEAQDVAAETLRLLEALAEAGAVEWRAAPVARLWESERAANPAAIPNPTFDLVADERRLAVRLAVWEAWRLVHDAASRLELAVHRYGADSFAPSGPGDSLNAGSAQSAANETGEQ